MIHFENLLCVNNFRQYFLIEFKLNEQNFELYNNSQKAHVYNDIYPRG